MLGKGLYEMAANEYRKYLGSIGDDPEFAADRVTAEYGLAVSLHRQGDPAGALGVLEDTRMQMTHPFAAEIALLRGACEYETGDYSSAAETLDRFLAAHGDHEAAARAGLMLIESLGALGETRSQEQAASAFLELWPGDAGASRVRLLAGIARVELGRVDDGAAMFETLVGGDSPEAAPAALRLAQLQDAAGDDGADENYRLATAGDAVTAAHAEFALARRMREGGDPGGAIGALEDWLEEPGDDGLVPLARLELGRALLDAGQAGRAIEPLEDAADAMDEPDADYWLAKARLATGDTDGAIVGFDALASDHTDHALAPYALFELGAALRQTGETELASEIFARLRRLYSQHELAPHALYAEAAIALDTGDNATAATLATRFVRSYPDDALAPDAALLLADAQYFSDRYSDAVRTLRSLHDAAPGFEPAYTAYRLGMALQRSGEPEDAGKALATAARGADDDARLRPATLAMADLAYERGDWRATVELADRFLSWGEHQPGAEDATLKAGLALAELGEHKRAIERFDSLLQSRRGSHLAHATYGKAVSLRALGDTDAARRLYTALLEMPDAKRFVSHARRALGAIALDAGDATEAERLFQLAAGSDGADPTDAINLAQAALAAGDAEGAIAALDDPSLRRASESVQTRGRVIEALARSRIGDYRGAIRLINSLLEDAELDESTAERLTYEGALALRELGNGEGAAEALRSLQRSSELGDRATLELASLSMETDDLESAAEALDVLLNRRDELPADVAELAVYRRGVVAHRVGDVSRAADLLGDFSERYPDSEAAVSADLIAGRAFVELGQHSQAAAHLQRVVDADAPDDQLAPALVLLAESLSEQQRFDGSLAARGRISNASATARCGSAHGLRKRGRLRILGVMRMLSSPTASSPTTTRVTRRRVRSSR